MNILRKHLSYYTFGKRFLNNKQYLEARQKGTLEASKKPSRITVINYLLSTFDRETNYLEIGVRNPAANFNEVKATVKYSVDPGVEFKENPVDFKMTSDQFFLKLAENEVLSKTIKFDVIFIDGLHLAEQVDRDIKNALTYLTTDGFIVLHDCNPPTVWHARENYDYPHSPAGGNWNGTTWKAFMKWRFNPEVKSCCIDTDWGVGIITQKHDIGSSITQVNTFYEYDILDKDREAQLNLISFNSLKNRL